MTRTRSRALAAALLWTAAAAGNPPATAHAQQNGQPTQTPEFLTAIPDAAAFTFLGTNPAQLQRPGTLRDLGVALINGVNADGQVQQGFALDISPWTLVPGFSINLERYQNDRLAFMAANTQLSLGTARSAGDTASTDVALGISITLLDRGDPMANRAFTQGLATALGPCRPDQPGLPLTTACVDSVTSAAFRDWARQRWNAPRLAVAAAAGGTFVDSQTGTRRWAGVDAWAVGSLPLTGSGELIAQGRFRQRPQLDTMSAFTSFDAGARAVFGTGTFNAFGEVVTESRSYRSGPQPIDSRNPSAWSGGVEFRLAPDMWLSTGFGSRYSGLGEPDHLLVFGHIRWGATSGARINSLWPGPGQ